MATAITGTGAPSPAFCFTPGTLIATSHGAQAIETPTPGDLLRTARGRTAPVRWVGRCGLDLAHHPRPDRVQPVRITAGAFGLDAYGRPMPARDLVVSPGQGLHAVVDGADVLIPAGDLVNGRTVVQLDWASVTYLNVQLDRHDLVLAEGLAAESYRDRGDRA